MQSGEIYLKDWKKRAHLSPRNGDRAPHFSQNERERGARQRKREAAGGWRRKREAVFGRRVHLLCRTSARVFRSPSVRRALPRSRKGRVQSPPFPFRDNTVFFVCGKLRPPSENQTMPCAIIASATLRKPAMFAPATKLPFIPYFSHASETFL